jgi:PST family polysaccharide transporter
MRRRGTPSHAPGIVRHDDRTLEIGDRTLGGDTTGVAVRGGTLTILAQALRHVMGLGSTVVLARLLTPADFGLVAMVVAVTSFVGIFRDLGLSTSTVQRFDLEAPQVSTLFWVNVVFGVATAAMVVALAPAVARFFGDERLTGITVLAAVTFICGGLTAQHRALLRRQMRFGTLAVIDTTAVGSSVGAAIALATYGAGYWALAVMPPVVAAVTAAGVWIGCDWRPGPPVRGAGVRSMLVFGANLTGAHLCAALQSNLDNVLIGKVWGAGPLGFYTKAYQLLRLPASLVEQPVGQVAVSLLCRLQHEPERYRAWYQKGVGLLVWFGMPVVALSFVAAERIVAVVLGPQWSETVPVFRLLAPAAFVLTFDQALSWVYLSFGQTHRMLRWALFASTVVVMAFFAGLPWGPRGVAAAFSVAVCALRIPAIVYCLRGSPLGPRDLLGVLWRPAVASIGAAVLLALANAFLLAEVGPIAGLAIDVLAYGLLYLTCWCLLPRGRAILTDILRLSRELAPRVEPAADPG